MKGKLPQPATNIEPQIDIGRMIERNNELEEIFNNLQPLLYTLSVALYGEDASDVALNTLIEDACRFINGREGTLQ